MRLPICLLLTGVLSVAACTRPDELYPEPTRGEQEEELQLTRLYVTWEKAYAEGETFGSLGRHLGYVKEAKDRTQQRLYVLYLVYDQEFKQPVGYYTEGGKTYRYPGGGEEEPVYLGTFPPAEAVGRLLGHDGNVIFQPMDWDRG